jgi:hypothetical protein
MRYRAAIDWRLIAPERRTRSKSATSRKMMSKVILLTPAFLLRMVLASWLRG